MEQRDPQPRIARAFTATLVGLLSGIISAIAVEPVGLTIENIAIMEDSLVGLLSMLALSVGLVFGVAGGIFGRWTLDFGWRDIVVWFVASIVGMGAAFYVAILAFDSQANSFVGPYLSASPVGALILGGGTAAFVPFADKWKLLASLLVLPTVWAVGVASALLNASSGDAMSEPWLMVLFCGWQAIFLAILAVWRRA